MLLPLVYNSLKVFSMSFIKKAVTCVFCFFLGSSTLLYAKEGEGVNEVSPEQSVAKLSLKHVLYSQYQADYLTAITDVLVSDSKQIWDHLPSPAQEGDKPLKQNLQLIEASLYHYFGMEKEAEKRYLSVVKNKSSHLPTAYLLLARYYHEQQQYKKSLTWVSKIDSTLLSERNQSLAKFFELDSLLRLGQGKKAETLLSSVSPSEWLPVLAYNSDRIKLANLKSKDNKDLDMMTPLLEVDEDELVPLQRELLANQMIQQGMDNAKKERWAKAVNFFAQVPVDSMRIVEAKRWLAWSLENNEEVESASRVWRSLTNSSGYQAIDAYIMSATTTEKVGDKSKALAWFEQGIGFYSDQLSILNGLRERLKKAEWFDSVETLNESFWSPVVLNIPANDELYLWTESVWHTESFQQLLADHRDLVQLSALLEEKQGYMSTFDIMVDNREKAFDKATQKISKMEADQRLVAYRKEAENHQGILDSASDYKDVFSIGTKEQLINQQLLQRVKDNIEKLKLMDGYAKKISVEPYEKRHTHLERIQIWEMREAFPSNYRKYQREIRGLMKNLGDSELALQKMKASKAIAPERFEGFSKKIADLNVKVVAVVDQALSLKARLKEASIKQLDQKLIEKERVAQNYLEQSILASARIRDEIANELSSSVPIKEPSFAGVGGGL